jgi:tetratricopeptide (TPR) repeat protein
VSLLLPHSGLPAGTTAAAVISAAAQSSAASAAATPARDTRGTPQPAAAAAAAAPAAAPVSAEAAAAALAAKDRGNAAFAAARWDEALVAYDEAVARDPSNHVFFSNRSACLLELATAAARGAAAAAGAAAALRERAVADARTCVKLAPGWVKGYFRLGRALMELERFEDAAHAFWDGVQKDKGGTAPELGRGFKEAIEQGKKQHQEAEARRLAAGGQA